MILYKPHHRNDDYHVKRRSEVLPDPLDYILDVYDILRHNKSTKKIHDTLRTGGPFTCGSCGSSSRSCGWHCASGLMRVRTRKGTRAHRRHERCASFLWCNVQKERGNRKASVAPSAGAVFRSILQKWRSFDRPTTYYVRSSGSPSRPVAFLEIKWATGEVAW